MTATIGIATNKLLARIASDHQKPDGLTLVPEKEKVTTLTRQITMEESLTDASDIDRLGCFLLGRQRLVCRPLRLLGLGVSSLREPTAKQLILL